MNFGGPLYLLKKSYRHGARGLSSDVHPTKSSCCSCCLGYTGVAYLFLIAFSLLQMRFPCLVSLPKKLYHCMKPCSPEQEECPRPPRSELCRRRYNGQEYLEKNITLGQYVSDRFFRPGNLCLLSIHY